MGYTANDYTGLIGMEGFSETLLNNHFTLYQGYITKTNDVFFKNINWGVVNARLK